MDWEQVGRRRWRVTDASITGEARISEIEGGFQAEIYAEDQEFGMTLLEETDFFESEQDARVFLTDAMEGS